MGGQGDRSVVVQFTRMGRLKNRHHTGGLLLDRHCVEAETLVEHVLDHLTELIRILPEPPGADGACAFSRLCPPELSTHLVPSDP